VTGDLHVNSTVGLLPYSVNLDDGGTYRSSKGQRWLWRNWLDFWDSVPKGEIWTVLNGDLVDVPGRHKNSQLISQNETDVMKMAVDVLQPALEVSERVFVVRGTAAHVGSSGYTEEKIALDIGAEKCGDNYSWWELLLNCDGVEFYITHHGPLGRLPHTHGNALNRRATEIEGLFAKRGVPQVACQSHNHHFSTSSDEYEVKVFALPSWQLKTEFAKRIGIIEPDMVGGLWFDCEDGEYQYNVRRYTLNGHGAWKP
jgi:hypothetical protein